MKAVRLHLVDGYDYVVDADDTDFSVTHVFDTSVNIHSVTASAMADPQTAVTFTVNTANIEVGPNGMYLVVVF